MKTKKKKDLNNLRQLMQERHMSSLALAKKIRTSAPHMSRLINGQSPLNQKWILKLSSVLKVPTYVIAGTRMKGGLAAGCDDTLLGSIMGWILEGSHKNKLGLSQTHLAKVTSFIYSYAIEKNLSFDEAEELSLFVVRLLMLLPAR